MTRWAVLIFAGCALTSKAPPLDIRYYAPEQSVEEAPAEPASGKLRLGRVSSGSHLRSRIAYRASPIELEFYETRRWTEDPDQFVRRALERELAARGVLVTGGRVPQLEVEVLGFEEIRGPHPAGRVKLHYRVVDDRVVVDDGVVEVTRPAAGGFDSVVVAIGSALDEASQRVVSQALAAPR